jgi:hypothetical protein
MKRVVVLWFVVMLVIMVFVGCRKRGIIYTDYQVKLLDGTEQVITAYTYRHIDKTESTYIFYHRDNGYNEPIIEITNVQSIEKPWVRF